MSKLRLSASVDADLIEAAENAVAAGHSESVSSWVNEALRLKLAQEQRLQALEAFVSGYEAAHGEITPEEMRLATRRARGSAIAVRGTRAKKSPAVDRGRISR